VITELLELRTGELEPVLSKVPKVLYGTEGPKSGLLVLSIVNKRGEGVHRDVGGVASANLAGNFDDDLVVVLHTLLSLCCGVVFGE